MAKFLCQEHGEQFIVEAETKEQAQEYAEMYGGECIRQLTKKEVDSMKPNGSFTIYN